MLTPLWTILRFISVTSYLAVFLVVWIFIPTLFKYLGFKIWYFSQLSSKLALWSFGVKFKIHNLDLLDKNCSYLFFANHSSWFDQLALCATLPMPLHFLANAKYFQYPMLKKAMNLYEHIPVYTNENNKLKAYHQQQIDLYIQRGDSIVVYPEATRSVSGTLYPFKTGMFLKAAKLKIKVVPIHILGADKIYPRKSKFWRIKSGCINVYLREPVTIDLIHWETHALELEKQFKFEHSRLKKEFNL